MKADFVDFVNPDLHLIRDRRGRQNQQLDANVVAPLEALEVAHAGKVAGPS